MGPKFVSLMNLENITALLQGLNYRGLDVDNDGYYKSKM